MSDPRSLKEQPDPDGDYVPDNSPGPPTSKIISGPPEVSGSREKYLDAGMAADLFLERNDELLRKILEGVVDYYNPLVFSVKDSRTATIIFSREGLSEKSSFVNIGLHYSGSEIGFVPGAAGVRTKDEIESYFAMGRVGNLSLDLEVGVTYSRNNRSGRISVSTLQRGKSFRDGWRFLERDDFIEGD